MEGHEIAEILKGALPQAVLADEASAPAPAATPAAPASPPAAAAGPPPAPAAPAPPLHPHVVVAAEAWHDVARFLRDDARLRLNMLRCISAVDLHPDPQIELVYELMSMRASDGAAPWANAGALAVKVRVPRDDPRIASVTDVWPTAEWHEREAFDLLGVVFTGHPDLRRILCPDDWAGWPLRKDYVFPTEYQGIPVAAAEGENVKK